MMFHVGAEQRRRANLGGLLPPVVLQGLVQVAVRTRALSFAHVKYGLNKGVETLLRAGGVAAERQVLCHPDKGTEIHTHTRTFKA